MKLFTSSSYRKFYVSGSQTTRGDEPGTVRLKKHIDSSKGKIAARKMAPVSKGIQKCHAQSRNSASQSSSNMLQCADVLRLQSIVHFFPFFFSPFSPFAAGGSSAATIAWTSQYDIKNDKRAKNTSSNTSLSLYWVSAEHSTYFTAPSSRAIRSPSSRFTGAILCLDSLSLTAASSRRSTCVPTIKHGTPGQW